MAELLLPAGIPEVMKKIRDRGYEAYLVGGCVRDRYMKLSPHDYDLTTSALPEEMLSIFEGERIIPTGLKHGTVTVLTESGPVEVTTYRQDGTYSDHRHPDEVAFTRSLREDLARRDFTMNAMAMDPAGEWVDPFGGRADIDARLIRCVGDPDRRFEEDALRILRGLRFSARLGFSLEPETAEAMRRKKHLLKEIAAERIFGELSGLLAGDFAPEILKKYGDILLEILPELCLFDENLCKMRTLPSLPAYRLAALLTEEGLAVLERLKVSNAFLGEVTLLVRERELPLVADRREVRRQCARLGVENFKKLCRYLGAEEALAAAERLEAERACISLSELAVGGKDLLALGYRGPAIGEALNRLLQLVVEEKLPNEKQVLLRELKKEL